MSATTTMHSSVLHEKIEVSDLVSAFPQSRAQDAARVVNRLRDDNRHWEVIVDARGRVPVVVGGDSLTIPYRVYASPKPRMPWLPVADSAIWDCLQSCSYDGHVRESAIGKAIRSGESFVIPYVVLLLGGYPKEIHYAIGKALAASDRLTDESFRTFAEQNPGFMALNLARATSYWNCYYRQTPRDEYKALKLLGRWMPR